MKELDLDLRIAVAGALVCAVVVVSIPVTAVRAVFAVPLCLILPGYAFTTSAAGRDRIPRLVLLMMVPAMSLVTLVVAALLLNLLPGGLNETSWAVLLVVIVVGECAVAAARRPSGAAPLAWRMPKLPWGQALMLAVALVLAAGALVLSRIPLAAPNAIGYTQLWMFSTGTPGALAVTIGLKSGEQHSTTYRVVVSSGSGAPTVVASSLKLRPGHSTTLNIPLHGVPGPESLVTTRLYRVNHPVVYRQVTALVASTPPAPSRLPRKATTSRSSRAGVRSGKSKLPARRR